MIGSVATTHIDMQKLFPVQKGEHLHQEHGLDVFTSNPFVLSCVL